MKKYFYSCDLFDTGTYSVRLSDEIYEFFGRTDSSFNIVMARILGLSYASFLRFARDRYNGILDGGSRYYITVGFENKKDCDDLCKVLNNRWVELTK